MKRTSLLICIVLLVSLLYIPASLAENTCPNHPYAGTYWSYPYSTESVNAVQHRTTERVLRCNRCNKILDEKFETDWHSFNRNGFCSVCGYKRPSKGELETHAWSHSSDIDLRNCYILYDSPVYASPNGASRHWNVTEFEEYRIIGSSERGDDLWLQIAKPLTTNEIGWIPANVAYVQDGDPVPPDPSVIGRTCEIVVGSGRARLRPAQDPVIETVHKGDKYKILDVTTGADGKTWYKIKKDGNECWISAGIAKVR